MVTQRCRGKFIHYVSGTSSVADPVLGEGFQKRPAAGLGSGRAQGLLGVMGLNIHKSEKEQRDQFPEKNLGDTVDSPHTHHPAPKPSVTRRTQPMNHLKEGLSASQEGQNSGTEVTGQPVVLSAAKGHSFCRVD